MFYGFQNSLEIEIWLIYGIHVFTQLRESQKALHIQPPPFLNTDVFKLLNIFLIISFSTW